MTFETCAQRGEGTSWLPNSIYSNFQRTNNDIAIKSSTGEHYGLWRWWWSVTYLIIQNVMSLPDKALKRRFFWNQPCQINFHFKCDAGETELFHSNLVRFPNPLAFGSGLGERTPKKAIFQLRRSVVWKKYIEGPKLGTYLEPAVHELSKNHPEN